MGLNKSKGNMYPWVDYTWNPVKGCRHDCMYCYLKVHKDFDFTPRLDEKELFTYLGKHNVIFVGSACDLFGTWVPAKWQELVFNVCRKHDNHYLFQTKDPFQFHRMLTAMPNKTILGTTIETNRSTEGISKAPEPRGRFEAMKAFAQRERMISIEPIMDFDLEVMADWIGAIKPSFISIGADSKGHKLPEPEPAKIADLIYAIQAMGIKVFIKKNLSRLTAGGIK